MEKKNGVKKKERVKAQSKKLKKAGKAAIKPEKEQTRGRQLAFITAYTAQANRFNISAACRDAGIGRRTFYKWKLSERFCELLDEAVQAKIDQVEAALFRKIIKGDTTAIIFFLKTIGKSRGYIEGERLRTAELPNKQATEILNSLIAGKIDPLAASLQFDRAGLPLPESLRLLLAKTQPPAAPPDLPPAMSDEELEAGYRQEMARIDDEHKKWLPERRDEVKALKDEMKDAESFVADAEIKKGDIGGTE